jgi:hypothetical protein
VGKNFEIIFKEFHNSETFVMSRELLEDYKRQAAQAERERIIGILENVETMFADSVNSPQKELMDGILSQVADYLVNEIKGEK